jgi:hypothetical protein
LIWLLLIAAVHDASVLRCLLACFYSDKLQWNALP